MNEIYKGRLVRDPIQKDPIFLLRVQRTVVFPDYSDIVHNGRHYEFDHEDPLGWVWIDPGNGEGDWLTDQDLVDHERACFYWDTESVWYTREEAVQWAASHEYRFSGARWDTRAVSATGSLRDILELQDREAAPLLTAGDVEAELDAVAARMRPRAPAGLHLTLSLHLPGTADQARAVMRLTAPQPKRRWRRLLWRLGMWLLGRAHTGLVDPYRRSK
jgi:hypothetical protein